MSRDHEPQPVLSHASVVAVFARYGVFTLLIAASIIAIWLLSKHHGDMLFVEDSPIEWAQLVILLATLAIFLSGALKSASFRQISLVLATLPALASIREQDSAFDDIILVLGWKLPFYLLVIGVATYYWRNRRIFLRQLRLLANHRSFALMWSGFMVAIPFAQMIGHGPFMEDVFGDDYQRTIKRLFEECGETIGYIMIFSASLDWTLSIRNESSGNVATQ